MKSGQGGEVTGQVWSGELEPEEEQEKNPMNRQDEGYCSKPAVLVIRKTTSGFQMPEQACNGDTV